MKYETYQHQSDEAPRKDPLRPYMFFCYPGLKEEATYPELPPLRIQGVVVVTMTEFLGLDSEPYNEDPPLDADPFY